MDEHRFFEEEELEEIDAELLEALKGLERTDLLTRKRIQWDRERAAPE